MPVLASRRRIEIRLNDAAAVQGYSFTIDYQEQGQSMWCWASCAHMILYAFNNRNNQNQCDIVNWALSRTDCCTDPQAATDENRCDQGIYTVKGGNPGYDHLDVWNHFGSLTADHAFGELAFSDIKTQTGNNQPLEVCWKWACPAGDPPDTDCGSHVVMLYGWSEDNGAESVWVADPDPDYEKGSILYSELESARNLGFWIETFSNIRNEANA